MWTFLEKQHVNRSCFVEESILCVDQLILCGKAGPLWTNPHSVDKLKMYGQVPIIQWIGPYYINKQGSLISPASCTHDPRFPVKHRKFATTFAHIKR